jgi:hypothetical protein
MLKWEYKVFASQLHPAELVVILNDSGSEGWELVALVAVTDYQPMYVVEPEAIVGSLPPEEAEESIPVQAFRYIFKRPLLHARKGLQEQPSHGPVSK